MRACMPASATSVLDVGCGDGLLAARLASRVQLVVAVDADAGLAGHDTDGWPTGPAKTANPFRVHPTRAAPSAGQFLPGRSASLTRMPGACAGRGGG